MNKRKKPRYSPRDPAPIRRRGVRMGMAVRCPWCGRAGVALTKTGLAAHPVGDLGRPRDPLCEGSGQSIAIGDHGQIVKSPETETP